MLHVVLKRIRGDTKLAKNTGERWGGSPKEEAVCSGCPRALAVLGGRWARGPQRLPFPHAGGFRLILQLISRTKPHCWPMIHIWRSSRPTRQLRPRSLGISCRRWPRWSQTRTRFRTKLWAPPLMQAVSQCEAGRTFETSWEQLGARPAVPGPSRTCRLLWSC